MSTALKTVPTRLTRIRQRSGWVPYAFIAPFFVLLLTFGIAPLAFSLWVSFNDWNPTSGVGFMKWSGLWAYNFTLNDPYFWNALARTLRTAVFSAVPQHLIAIPLAFVLHMAFKRLQGAIGTIFFLPYMTSSIAAGSVLLSFFSFTWGVLDWVLSQLSGLPVIGGLIPNLYAYRTEGYAAFVQLWTTVGWNVLLYLMVLNTIPRSLYEAAQIDGAGFWRMFRHVALPLLRPMIFVAFTMSFLRGIQSASNDWYSSRFDPRVTDLPTYIIRTGFWDFDMGLASEMTIVFFLGMIAIVLVVYGLIGRNFSSVASSAHTESDQPAMRFSPASRVLLKLALFVALVASILPIVMVLLNATRAFSSGDIDLSIGDALGANLTVLLQALPHFWGNLWNSVYICTLAALGAVATSSLSAYAFSFLEFRGRTPLYALVLGVMLFPSLLNLIPTVLVMAVIGWLDQARAIWVPAVVSAFGVFLTRQYLVAAVPKELLEAARVDGAGELRIFATIVLPLARPVLATLALLTFVTVWNNAGAALAILKNPDVQMLTQALSTISNAGSSVAVGIGIATVPALVLFTICAGQIARGMNISSPIRFALANALPRFSSLPANPNAILGADGVRAVACLMVVFHHLSQRLNRPEQTKLVQEAQAFVMTGAVGVSAFFVLSGLLLSIPFWRAFQSGKPFPNLLEFARRRAVRIVPGFYASLCLSALLTAFFVPDAQAVVLRFVSGLTFTSALHYVTLFPADLNGPLWSIGFEVLCYAAMPLGMAGMFALYARTGARASIRTGLVFWLGVLIVTLIAHQLILVNLVPDSLDRGWEHGIVGGAKYWMPNYNAVGMFAHYILGVLAAGVIVNLKSVSRASSWWFDLGALVALTGLIALLWLLRYAPDFAFSIGAQPYFFPSFPLLVAVVLTTLPFSRLLGRIVDNSFARYTARLSFGLYIWHYLILELIRLTVIPDFHYFGISSLNQHLLISGLALVLAYGAAGLSYRHIEAPFLEGSRPKSRETGG